MVQLARSGDPKPYSAFLTPEAVIREYIAPDLIEQLDRYCWVDLFAGRGDLLFGLLESVPRPKRSAFFDAQMRLFDIQPAMVEACQQRAMALGVSADVARRRIRVLDTLLIYPEDIFQAEKPVYHVTNPPFLYLGLAKKRAEWSRFQLYFSGDHQGLQDLYQVALANDLRYGVPRMLYVLPTNFLFAEVGAQKIRQDLLAFYWLKKAVLFEYGVFDQTGVHTGLFWFERKETPGHHQQTVLTLKPEKGGSFESVRLSYWNGYRPGSSFQSFIKRFRQNRPLRVSFHLPLHRLNKPMENSPCTTIRVADMSRYKHGSYKVLELSVPTEVAHQLRGQRIFVRTLDGVRNDQRAGFYFVDEAFDVDTLVISKTPFRTHPALVILEPTLDDETLTLLKDYANMVLNYFREQTDSSFLTTFKYSKGIVRKYFGLKQARAILETFPYPLSDTQKRELRQILDRRDPTALIDWLARYNRKELSLFEGNGHATERERLSAVS